MLIGLMATPRSQPGDLRFRAEQEGGHTRLKGISGKNGKTMAPKTNTRQVERAEARDVDVGLRNSRSQWEAQVRWRRERQT